MCCFQRISGFLSKEKFKQFSVETLHEMVRNETPNNKRYLNNQISKKVSQPVSPGVETCNFQNVVLIRFTLLDKINSAESHDGIRDIDPKKRKIS